MTVGAMILGLLLTGAIFIGVVAALMWATARWIGRWLAMVVGGIAFVYISYTITDGVIYCAADPVYIPPTNAEAAAGSEGAMRFNCDSAGGVLDRLYLHFAAPLLLLLLGLMLWRASRKGAPL